MRKMPELGNKFIKIVSVALAGVLTVTAVVQYVKKTSITAEAMQDTLPGIEKLRTDYSGTDKTFRILELAPNVDAAEIGFYVSGQEPLPGLKGEDGAWLSVQEKLGTFATKEERVDFMQTMKTDAEVVLDSLAGDGEAPFSVSEYEEREFATTAEAEAAGYQSLELGERSVRGYFQAQADGEWQVIFKKTNNTSLTIDEVRYGTDTPYYVATPGDPVTVGQLLALYSSAPDTMLYYLSSGYLKEAVTVSQLLTSVPSVSAGDAADTVSGNDAIGNVIDAYYVPTFTLTFETTQDLTGKAIYQAASYVHCVTGGNYTLVTAEEGIKPGIGCNLAAQTVYYKGGLQNTDLLRSTVLGLETEEEREAFSLEVITLTPGMLNQMYSNGTLTADYLKQFNLFYYNVSTLRTQPGGLTHYSYTEDLNNNVLELLASYLTKNEVPSIVECSEVIALNNEWYVSSPWTGNGFNNREKLLSVLLSRDKAQYFSDENYTTLQDDFKQYSDEWRRGNCFNNADGNGINMVAVDKDSTGKYDCYFVKDNVLAYLGSKIPFVRKGFSDFYYSELYLSGGFTAVQEELKTENLYRRADYSYTGRPELDTRVNDAAVVRYILNYPNRRMDSTKTSLRILEIEPATATSQLTENTVKGWMGLQSTDTTVNITIDTMPITQFIGIIDDLNAEYDMIYIGDSMSGLTLNDAKTATVYNDSGMNGLIYSHVGDLVVKKFNLSGTLSTDKDENGAYYETTQHRYSGNDLTVEKYNALLDYLEAYYPIVVGDDLVNMSGTTVTGINGDKVDNSSYLYEFLEQVFATGQNQTGQRADNVFRESELSGASGSVNTLFRFSLNKPKLFLESFEIQNTSAYTLNGAGNLNAVTNENIRVLSRKEDGSFELSYKFVIRNEGAVSPNTDYQCRLYLDANADGKFSAENEELQNLTITTEDGTAVDNDALQAGVTYVVTRRISESYNGCITWKLAVEQEGNDRIRTCQTGYVKLNTGYPAVINILQVYFHSTKEDNIILQEQIGTWNGATYEGGDNTSYFYNLARQMQNEFVLNITSISRSQFESYLSTGRYTDDNRHVQTPGDTWMESMDMLIVGFSDAYKSSNVNNDWSVKAAQAVRDFAESGRSVLLGHDLTSLVNIPGSDMHNDLKVSIHGKEDQTFDDWYWGYQMNQQVRGILGMDMYGVTTSPNTEGMSKDEEGRYLYNTKDMAWAPKQGRNTVISQIQGYTYPLLMTRDFTDSGNSVTYRSGIGDYSTQRTLFTYSAAQTNDGQITHYPYEVSETLSVEKTHYQYYTLDLNSDTDDDGQTDLVVWYTLQKGADGSDIYSSIQDVRNNYYLYSKGNILYTGMGHSGKVTLDEAKLFMNTMIASYQAGKKSPEVITQDAMGITRNTIYHYYDNALTEGESLENIYFTVNDLNMTPGVKTLSLEFYLEDPSGTDDIGTPTKVTKYDWKVYYADGTEVTDNYVPGTRYMIRVPTGLLQPTDTLGNAVNIYIRAKTTMTFRGIITGLEQVSESPWGVSEISYMNCQLFNLD